MKYYGEIKDDYSVVHKKFVNEAIQSSLSDVSKLYIKNSIVEMEEITEATQGDFCLIVSVESENFEARSLYCYFSHISDTLGSLESKWIWISDLGISSLKSLVILENGEWDLLDGNTAKLLLTSDTLLNITNVKEGECGVIDVYGDFNLTLPSNSYSFPPDWDYLTPNSNQHYRYSFYYDGSKFDWNRSVRENE